MRAKQLRGLQLFQRSHFLPLLSKRGAKTGEAWKRHIIIYNGGKQPMKKNKM